MVVISMKKFSALLLTFVMILTLGTSAFADSYGTENVPINGSRIIASYFDSYTADDERDFYVYIPAGFESNPDLRFPSVYMMPFDGFSPDRYFTDGIHSRLDEIMGSLDVLEMVVVFPAFYPGDDFRGIISDLVQYIETEFEITKGRLINAPAGRGILGASVGGYMAFASAFTDPITGNTLANTANPHTFTGVGSIMGNFVDPSNPWLELVEYRALTHMNAANRAFVERHSIYIDGGAGDIFTSQDGSTGDLIFRFRNLGAGAWGPIHPNRVDISMRPGGHDTEFYMHSLGRAFPRFSNRFAGAIGTGGINAGWGILTANSIVTGASNFSATPGAVVATVESITVNYDVRIAATLNNFIVPEANVDIPMTITLQLTDPVTGILLHTDSQVVGSIAANQSYTGSFIVPRSGLAIGSSTNTEILVDVLGTTFSLGTSSIINVLPTGSAPHEQLIDLMGDWSFRPYKAGNNPHPLDWYPAIMEEWHPDPAQRIGHWDYVQPGLGWWDGNHSTSTDPPWPGNGNFVGHAWYIREFYVPYEFAREGLLFSVGLFDEENITYINGHVVGAVGFGTGQYGTMQGIWPLPVRSGGANNIVPGQYLNSLADISGRQRDNTNPWDIRAEYQLDSSVLIYGGMNRVAVRVSNMSGGGGWYSGPIGIFSIPALNRARGLPYLTADSKTATLVRDFVAIQKAYLEAGDFEGFAATVASNFSQNGLNRARYLETIEKWLVASPEGVTVDDQVTFVFVQDGQLIYQAERTVRAEDNTVLWAGQIQYGYKIENIDGLNETRVIFGGTRNRLFHNTIFSNETGQVQRFAVYLPPSYYEPGNENRRFPVQYLFHGINSTGDAWVINDVKGEMDRAIAAGEIEEMILIMPDDHNRSSWWSGITERYVIYELIPYVDANYRTIPDARFRGTAGFSMGAAGSYGMALRNYNMFTFLTNFNGAASGPSASATGATLTLIQNAAPSFLHRFSHFQICGAQDSFAGFIGVITNMNRALTRVGVEHFALIDQGGHDSDFYMPFFITQIAYHQARMYNPGMIVNDVIKGDIAASVAGNELSAVVNVNIAEDISRHFESVPSPDGTTTMLPLAIPINVRVVQNDRIVHSHTFIETVSEGAELETVKLSVPAGVVNLYENSHVYLYASILNHTFLIDEAEIEALKPAITVTFNPNGGIVNPTSRVVITNETFGGAFPMPRREGYRFLGWFTAIEGGTRIVGTQRVTQTSDLTLFARWEQGDTLTVTFDATGGTVSQVSRVVRTGETFGGAFPMPRKDNHVFEGWFTAPIDGTRILGTHVVNHTTNFTLYARWREAGRITVTFNPNGGTTTEAYRHVYSGATFGGAFRMPTRQGYIFEGWFTAVEGGTRVIGTQTVTQTNSFTLFARWRLAPVQRITVTFNPMGGNVTELTREVTIGDTFGGAFRMPHRPGYVFEGWFTTPTTGGARVLGTQRVTQNVDFTLFARWRPDN